MCVTIHDFNVAFDEMYGTENEGISKKKKKKQKISRDFWFFWFLLRFFWNPKKFPFSWVSSPFLSSFPFHSIHFPFPLLLPLFSHPFLFLFIVFLVLFLFFLLFSSFVFKRKRKRIWGGQKSSAQQIGFEICPGKTIKMGPFQSLIWPKSGGSRSPKLKPIRRNPLILIVTSLSFLSPFIFLFSSFIHSSCSVSNRIYRSIGYPREGGRSVHPLF